MRNLLECWGKIKAALADREIRLFLDFDGTLAPIRKHPDNAALSADRRRLLERLASLEDVTVAIVTGRSVRDIRRLVRIRNAVYIGNHGFELKRPGSALFRMGNARTEKTMKTLAGALKRAFAREKGVLVDDKGITLAVHFRMARPGSKKTVEKIFRKTISPYVSRAQVTVTRGKKVWEIRPPVRWNKGMMVLKEIRVREAASDLKRKAAIFYIGDDKTDEDAFRLLSRRSGAYTVKVGKTKTEKTAARYGVRNTGEVEKLLRELYALKKERV